MTMDNYGVAFHLGRVVELDDDRDRAVSTVAGEVSFVDHFNVYAGRLTTTHEPIDVEPIVLSFTYDECDIGRNGRVLRDSGGGGADMGGAIRRVLASSNLELALRDARLDAAELAELAELADRWHLSAMQAACAHQPRYAELEGEHRAIVRGARPAWLAAPETALTVPESYGRPDWTGWALKHVVCPETGYRYGSAWLCELVPDAVARRVAELVRKAAPEGAFDRMAERAAGRSPAFDELAGAVKA